MGASNTQGRSSSARYARVASLLALTALGLSFGRAVGRLLRVRSDSLLEVSPREVAFVPIVVLGALFLVVLAHELGHLFAARLVGFRAYLLIIGPVRIERHARRWRLKLNRSLKLAGGLAGSAPTDTSRLRLRKAIVVAAGPAVSLMLGCAAMAVLRKSQFASVYTEGWQRDLAMQVALLTIAFMSSIIGLLTLVPGRTAGLLTDGAQLRILWSGGPEAERHLAIGAIIGASLIGTRPRDWSPQLIANACAFADGSESDVMALSFAQSHAADAGRTDEARDLLERVLQHLDRVPAAMQTALRHDAARQLAQWGSMDRAREVLAITPDPTSGSEFLRQLAEAAVAVGEGNAERAIRAVADARRLLREDADSGSRVMYREIADALDSRARALTTAT